MLQRSFSRFSWKSLVEPWQEVDWTLFLTPIALTILGGISIRSIELSQGYTDWWQHWIMGGIGIVVALLLARWRTTISFNGKG